MDGFESQTNFFLLFSFALNWLVFGVSQWMIMIETVRRRCSTFNLFRETTIEYRMLINRLFWATQVLDLLWLIVFEMELWNFVRLRRFRRKTLSFLSLDFFFSLVSVTILTINLFQSNLSLLFFDLFRSIESIDRIRMKLFGSELISQLEKNESINKVRPLLKTSQFYCSKTI